MKKHLKLISLAGSILILFACAGMFAPVPLPPEFCNDSGDRSESWLLEVSGKLVKDGQMSSEDMLSTIYYSMIRLTAIGQLASDDRDFIEKWWRKVGEFYLEHAPNITYNDLIDYMFSKEEWGDKINLIKIIVTPQASQYKSIASIKPWDDCALRSGHKNVGEIFGWEPVK
jgi:hypothetical protein